MKKCLILLIAVVMAAGSASAATLVINGTVAPYLNLLVSSSPITVTFVGNGSAGTANHSAFLNVKANTLAWTVTFHSGNGGLLKSPTTGVNIPYYLQASGTVPGATMTNGLTTATQLTTDQTIKATATGKTSKDGVDFQLDVTVSAQAGIDTLWEAATDYSDTITIQIVSP